LNHQTGFSQSLSISLSADDIRDLIKPMRKTSCAHFPNPNFWRYGNAPKGYGWKFIVLICGNIPKRQTQEFKLGLK
jgi:hypothetical protein